VRLVVPSAPGGPADIVARSLGLFLGRANQRKYVSENRAGASGLIGAAHVAQAEPDGNTLLIAGAGSFLLAREPDSPKIDLMEDLEMIGIIAGSPMLIVTDTRQGPTTLKRLVEDSARHKKPLSWGSPGVSTFGYFLGQSVLRRAGAGEAIHVPYKGGSQALTDLLSGNLQMVSMTVSGALPLILSGQLQAVAISSAARNPLLPNTPTYSELGHKDLTSLIWFALLAPRNTPASTVNQLRRDLSLVRKDPEFIEAMKAASLDVSALEPARTKAFVQTEIERWSRFQRENTPPRSAEPPARP
jgi:tripartite-type tricarboxylate transporter receptor subunit TctC